MKHIVWVLVFAVQLASAQKIKKADKAIIDNLQQHINYLADDKLEGRRTGTNGEKLAAEYIIKNFEKAGFSSRGENGSYLQPFEVNDGKEVTKASHLIINDYDLKLHEEYFPFTFSPNKSFETTASLALQESGNPWFLDIRDLLEANKTNPHFDLIGSIKGQAAEAEKKGANALFVFNSSAIADGLKFEPRDKEPALKIPVRHFGGYPRTYSLDPYLPFELWPKKR